MEQEQTLKTIDKVWRQWDKTRDLKYKDLWFKLIKEWADGRNNNTRRAISSLPSDKKLVHRGDFTRNY